MTKGYRGLERVTGGNRGLQGKRLQGVIGGYRGVTGGYRGLQGVTRGYRGLQGVKRG